MFSDAAESTAYQQPNPERERNQTKAACQKAVSGEQPGKSET